MRARIAALIGLIGLIALTGVPAVAQQAPRAPQPPRTPHPVVTPQTPHTRAPLTFGFMLKAGPPPEVLEVLPGLAAQRAGVQKGDVLVTIDGQAATVELVHQAARRLTPGDTVRLRIRRNGGERVIAVVPEARTYVRAPRPSTQRERDRQRNRERVVVIHADSVRGLVELYLDQARDALELHGDIELNLDLDLDGSHFDSLGKELGEQLRLLGPQLEGQLQDLGEMRFEAPPFEFNFDGMGLVPGARLMELNDQLARYFPGAGEGALVLSVRPGSRADEAGLEAGDVIVAIDGASVRDPGDLLGAAEEDGEHDVQVVRHGERLTLRLER